MNKSKEKLDAIRRGYRSTGEVIFRTAIIMIVECGQNSENLFREEILRIDERHNAAEANDKFLGMTREFEKAIYECAIELAQIDTCDLIMYIQREIWFYGEFGEPDYQRALQIVRNCMWSAAGYYNYTNEEKLYKFREMELTDEEIEYFGWAEVLEEEL